MSRYEKTELGAPTLLGSTLVDDPELRKSLARELMGTPELPGDTGRGAVLVVETEPGKPMAQALEQAGFAVRATDDGVVATQLASSMRFDAVLADIGARSMDGLELLRFVREQDTSLPVLLMTGAPDVEQAAQAVEHGAFQYLLKPIPSDRLLLALDKAVRTRRVALEHQAAFAALQDHETVETSKAEALTRFHGCLQKLFMMYQPIVLPGGKLYAYEALVRSEEPTLRGAGEILDMAELVSGMRELGRTVRARAGEFAVQAHGKHYLFVNLHADDLLDELLSMPTEPLSQVAPAVVLEITERAALHDVEEAKVKISELRSMGFRIALDDLGAGYAGLTSFTQIRPDVVKLDMALVRDVDKDAVKRKLIRSVIDVSRDMGTLVVGEGVETPAERDTLVEMGCHLLQGYLFGKPARI